MENKASLRKWLLPGVILFMFAISLAALFLALFYNIRLKKTSRVRAGRMHELSFESPSAPLLVTVNMEPPFPGPLYNIRLTTSGDQLVTFETVSRTSSSVTLRLPAIRQERFLAGGDLGIIYSTFAQNPTEEGEAYSLTVTPGSMALATAVTRVFPLNNGYQKTAWDLSGSTLGPVSATTAEAEAGVLVSPDGTHALVWLEHNADVLFLPSMVVRSLFGKGVPRAVGRSGKVLCVDTVTGTCTLVSADVLTPDIDCGPGTVLMDVSEQPFGLVKNQPAVLVGQYLLHESTGARLSDQLPQEVGFPKFRAGAFTGTEGQLLVLWENATADEWVGVCYRDTKRVGRLGAGTNMLARPGKVKVGAQPTEQGVLLRVGLSNGVVLTTSYGTVGSICLPPTPHEGEQRLVKGAFGDTPTLILARENVVSTVSDGYFWVATYVD